MDSGNKTSPSNEKWEEETECPDRAWREHLGIWTEKGTYLRPGGQKVQPCQQLREVCSYEGPGVGELGV